MRLPNSTAYNLSSLLLVRLSERTREATTRLSPGHSTADQRASGSLAGLGRRSGLLSTVPRLAGCPSHSTPQTGYVAGTLSATVPSVAAKTPAGTPGCTRRGHGE